MQDCEKIQNPMEFNLCLASLSPEKQRRASTGARPPPDADAPKSRRRHAARPDASRSANSDLSYDPLAPKPTRSGRKAMEFDVTASGKKSR